MYNRHLHQKHQHILTKQHRKELICKNLVERRKKDIIQMTKHYKQRVASFLVQMAKQPIQLAQYQSPIKDIIRSVHQDKNIATSQLIINDFKTNRERRTRVMQDIPIRDYTPTTTPALNHEFRSRILTKEIQSRMRFNGSNSHKSINVSNINSNRSLLKFPSININSQTKMHFKAIEEMSNKLQSMEQSESSMKKLMIKLSGLTGKDQMSLQKRSLHILRICKFTKSKTLGNEVLKQSMSH